MITPTYKEAAPGYASLWADMSIRGEHLSEVKAEAQRIIRNRDQYEAVGLLPWHLIGVIHGLECDGSFRQHLHNGDPLTRGGVPAPTVQVPAGRGPFPDWHSSARDAIGMKIKTLDPDVLISIQATYIPAWLYFLERYNGFAYRNHGINSPYLFSFTNQYKAGKYVRDGEFSLTAVSNQCGGAPVIKILMEMDRAERG